MKHIYIAALFILFSFYSYATADTVIVNNGIWSQTSTWTKNHVPANGDTVVIPENYTLVIDNNLNISSWALYIKVYGTLNLSVGKLDIGINSVIILYGTGKVSSTNNNNGDKILIGGVPKYLGSNGTITGPVIASQITGVAPSGFSAISMIVLPVKFVGFSVACKGSDVLIQWSTSEESNSYQYELERSFDATTWNTIAIISAPGNSNALHHYSYTDKNTTSRTAYYRVKQVDLGGRSIYTAVKSIKTNTTNTAVQIACVQNKVVLQFPQEVKNGVSVRIVSLSGNVIKEQRIEQAFGQVILNTSVKGNYVVSVSNGQDLSIARQVVL